MYPIVYIDAIWLKIRDGGVVANKAGHVAVGVDLEGRKQVLGLWLGATEGAKFWANVLTEIRNRGTKDILILCCDGLSGLPAAVTDSTGATHRIVEADHTRSMATVFGEVTVRRLAYRERGQSNLHPVDAALNLPVEKQSHGLRRLAARDAFDEARTALTAATGVKTGKRPVEALTVRAATDFYAARRRPEPASDAELLVLQVDGKGIVMRLDALRPATIRRTASTADRAPRHAGVPAKRPDASPTRHPT